ncbi:hypothetical protein Adeg_0677 [Ammonifex degensii KC4]|uniref:DUF1257 domain-containing protein n=1 Tax=Ammonifex degensii (strain DSM 10501 / KC4) TaxID=429009 RepID=C9RC47_AMMDK|nr:DUF1257 domain-containing protein [Ammonifex degensii]ACX51824.1 hypothetical protein Adeg_0677 [Ammonifex degensii KC4]
MSHFATVRTQIRDLGLLDEAAMELGLVVSSRREVRGWAGQLHQADRVYEVPGHRYDVGVVRQDDGTYALVADWWGVEQKAPGLQGRLLQEYAVKAVLRQAKLLGQRAVVRRESGGVVQIKISV